MSSSFGSDSSSSSNSNYDQKLEVPKEDKTPTPAVQKKQLSQVNLNNLTRSMPQINTDKNLAALNIAKNRREVDHLLIRPIRMQAQDSKVTIDEEI